MGGVIDWKSKNIEDELSIYVLLSQSLVDQLGEGLRIKKGKPGEMDLPSLKNDITGSEPTVKILDKLQKSQP